MPDAERFPFTAASDAWGEASLLPQVPIRLANQSRSIDGVGLLDTGATVNVLPHNLGVDLGFVWNENAATIRLSGNLAHFQACPVVAFAKVGSFDAVRLAFAWTQSNDIPLILGQVNFFMEFDVCFYRSQQTFEVRPKG